MKKLYASLFIAALASTAVNAQTNLVPNGDFEAWTDGAPEGFTVTPATNGGTVTQSTTELHGGASAALFTAPAGTGNVKAAIADIPVTAGHTYVFSYWFKDESDNARGRHWASWRVDTATQLTDNADVLQPGYYENTSGWQQVTYTLTAPATATLFRLDFRVYQQADGANSGLIYYDDVMFYDQATAGVNQNDIAGLKVFPNPLSGNVLNVTSNTNGVKEVAIYDIIGKQVFAGKTVNNTVNVNNLTAGVYIVNITEEGKTATRKLVVK
ncbi:T9SS type A sorting domain-containing protein [Flavobacterium sp. RHBU_3]|uniref:T9SS type A sorting domain-containing protein n=1 Tax=Flavobacterium sp. RHBU_3 TaxID=3391184 RepID=UPI003984B0CB